MSDDEFELFIVINLRLRRQMLKMAFDAWTMCWAIDSDSDRSQTTLILPQLAALVACLCVATDEGQWQ